MRRSNLGLAFVIAGLILQVAGCGGGSGGGASQPNPNPMPVITSLSPASVLVGAASQTLTINGTNFISTSTVTYNGTAHTATLVNSSQLSVSLSASDLATAGSYAVVVTNPAPGGGSSLASEFQVAAAALTVNIIDLPPGVAANVNVTAPDGSNISLISSQEILGDAGTYTVTAQRVRSSLESYYATAPSQTAVLSTGNSTTVTVDYYNVIPNTTKLLDQAGRQSLTISADGTTLTISNSSAVGNSLQTGDVLVSIPTSAAPNGLIRKILSVNTSGSNIVVTTSQGTLADEVTRARINATLPLGLPATESDSRSGRSWAAKKPTQRPAVNSTTLSNPCSSATNAFQVPISSSTPPDSSGDTINASGQVEICVANVTLVIDTGSLSASYAATLGEYSRIVVQGRYSTSFSQQIDLDPQEIATQVLCLGNQDCQAALGLSDSIANAILVITPVYTPFIGIEGNASGGFYTGITEAGQLTVGLAVQDLGLQPVSSSSGIQTSFDPPSVDGNATVKGYAGVKIGLEFFGSDTFDVAPDEYLQLNVNTGNDPWLTLTVGGEADAEASLSILGFWSQDFDTQEFPIFSSIIYQSSGPFSAQAVLNSITPSSAQVNSPALSLALTGSNFVPGAVVNFNGLPLSTTFVDSTSLTAILPASDLVAAGMIPVTVANPPPDGGSNTVNFIVVATPMVTISPSSAQVPVNGLQQFTAAVTDESNSAVTWSVNGVVGGNSTVGTITVGGTYTAPAAVPSPATVTVTATSQADSSLSGSAVVTVGPYTVKDLYSFTSLTDGAAPSAPLIQASDGFFYGTTQVGGTSGDGTVFKVDASGNVTPLHEFSGSDGANPLGALIQANDGNFYGTTQLGGSSGEGVIFKMDSLGNVTALYSFTRGDDGGEPVAGLIQASDGYFYGTTYYGGTSDSGTIFRADSSGNLTTLYSFSGGDDGFGPDAPLIQATDGNFYSTAIGGGNLSCEIWPVTGCGTIFRIDSSGNLTTLYSFSGGTDGANPIEALLQVDDGSFYGTTVFGGDASCSVSGYLGCGSIFKIDTAGNFTVLHDFSGGAEGGVPISALIQATDGDFYGTATAGGNISCSVIASGENYPTYNGCGTVFKMDSAGNVVALYSFAGSPNDGSNPFASLLEGSDGYFYGTTRWGGSESCSNYTNDGGCGTVFQLAGPNGPLPQLRRSQKALRPPRVPGRPADAGGLPKRTAKATRKRTRSAAAPSSVRNR